MAKQAICLSWDPTGVQVLALGLTLRLVTIVAAAAMSLM